MVVMLGKLVNEWIPWKSSDEVVFHMQMCWLSCIECEIPWQASWCHNKYSYWVSCSAAGWTRPTWFQDSVKLKTVVGTFYSCHSKYWWHFALASWFQVYSPFDSLKKKKKRPVKRNTFIVGRPQWALGFCSHTLACCASLNKTPSDQPGFFPKCLGHHLVGQCVVSHQF